jgi:PAS domain S-box-containing protein
MKILSVDDDLTVTGELNDASTLAFEGLSMDPSGHRVVYRDQVLTLSPKTYGILELLLGNPEKSFNSEAILSHVWTSLDMPGEETVRLHIKDLRQKLTALGAPKDLIKTQRQKGYRLNPLYATVASSIDDQLTPPQVTQLNNTNEALRSTMEELRSTQAELQQKNQELQAVHAELERRVIDRTAELQALYDHAPCGYHSLDAEGHIVQINETELRMFGYAREEMIGRKITDFYTPEGLQIFQENYPKFIQQGWVSDLKFTIVRKDGSLLPISLSANAVKDEAGHYLMSHSIMVDNSDRKRREASTALLSELTASFSYPLSASEIIQTVGEKLNAYLNIAACNFCEIDEVHDQVVYLGRWHREETPQLPDRLCLSEQVNPAFLQQIRTGETIVSHNIQTSITTNAEANSSIGVQAFITVPFFKSGEWKYLFSIHENSPRIWREDEIELVREVANCMVPRIERAHTEIALRHNQEMFSALVKNAPFGIYLIDAEFRLQQINRGAEAVFSNIEPLIGRDFNEILRILWPEPFATEALNYFHHTIASGESYYSPVIVEQRANIDEMQAYDWQIHRIILPDGDYGVVCYFYDLSEIKRTEAALSESKQLLQLAMTGAQAGSWDWMLATGTLTWSPETYRLHGLDPNAPLPEYEGWYENCLHPNDRVLVNHYISQVIEQRQPNIYLEFRIVHPQKGIRWILSLGHLTVNEQGEPARMSGISLDISDRKQVELTLQKQIQQEYLLNDIAQEIRRSLHLDDVLASTVQRVRAFLETDRVIIFRFAPDWIGEVIMESVGADWQPILSNNITDPCFNDRYIEPYRQGRISTIVDVDREDLEPCHVELLKSFQVRANLVVPILVNEALWGLLIAHHCATPREWQATEIALLQRLSTQVSIAIQQAELYQNLQTELIERQQAEQKIREQAALLDISSDAIFVRDLEHRILYWNQGAERHLQIHPHRPRINHSRAVDIGAR